MNDDDIARFDVEGFVVVNAAVDAAALRAEVVAHVDGAGIDTGVARVRYAPLMTRRTPTSLGLVASLAPSAAALLGGPVLPLRAKGMRYTGDTRWHRDSEGRVASVGFAAYLDVLTPSTGALRLLPGSHKGGYADAVAARVGANDVAAAELPGVAPSTSPGDLLVFDERLFHGSAGGGERLQWRVDYVRAPTSAAEEVEVRAWYAQVFDPGWDGGYDVDGAPSYDVDWRVASPFSPALARLGVYALCDAQEAFMRQRRSAASAARS